MALKCPRCATVFPGNDAKVARCPDCDYPGPDKRNQFDTAGGFIGSPPMGPKPPAGQGFVTGAHVCSLLGILFVPVGLLGIVLAMLGKAKGHPRATAALWVAVACTVASTVLLAGYLLWQRPTL